MVLLVSNARTATMSCYWHFLVNEDIFVHLVIRKGWWSSASGFAKKSSRPYPLRAVGSTSRRPPSFRSSVYFVEDAYRKSCAGIFLEPVLDLIGEPKTALRPQSLWLGGSESPLHNRRAGLKGCARCGCRHTDVRGFSTGISPPPTYPCFRRLLS
jgi:hypothetical protein